ncbi:hypothetical protein SEA_FAUST_185 [Streptomyces phage Faust]|uniref:Uncharacterized protein n=1 Tax=Streptomyces phage Faust TaxID=2767565 RepID=A0A7G9UZ02_9CAUD|nr:hypothetical protein PP456_gp102 [Streptomyces phage Faust]QNN99257.1 hypothetical protein SEA_FAUST_185 [Streptomyces phage Faust]
MLELFLIAWLIGAAIAFVSCSAWLYTAFTRGGIRDGLLALCAVTTIAALFVPLSLFGIVLMVSEKVKGKES